MDTRRTILYSLAGMVAASPFMVATAQTAGGESAADEPVIKLIKSKPPVLDFGHGVLVPCTKDAFLTLWESPTYWLTFGVGISSQSARAKAISRKFAVASMRLLLLTLAFAPDRLAKVDGNGWRLSSASGDYVKGEMELPGKPSAPMTDASLGFGDSDQSLFIGSLPTLGRGGITPADPAITGINPAMMHGKVHAYCVYVVQKSELTLDDVRKRAQLENG